MPPKKKAKTNGVTMDDFLCVLTELSNLYEKQGDERRAKSFAAARENLEKCFNRPENPWTIDLERVDLERVWRGLETDYKNIKGVGKSTLELMDEFTRLGRCQA